jgi:hypothetical protein
MSPGDALAVGAATAVRITGTDHAAPMLTARRLTSLLPVVSCSLLP